MLEYYTIAMIALLAAISPGPDFVIVVRNALAHHRSSAIYTSFGITAGVLVHTTYCMLGLAIIISGSLFLFISIKYLGAAYLIYLGVKSLRSQADNGAALAKKIVPTEMTNGKAFRDGFLTNVLNPKCTLFILSVFTVVVKPHTPLLVQCIYALEIALIGLTWFVFLSFALTHQSVKDRMVNVQHIVTKVIGVVLLGLGVSIIVSFR